MSKVPTTLPQNEECSRAADGAPFRIPTSDRFGKRRSRHLRRGGDMRTNKKIADKSASRRPSGCHGLVGATGSPYSSAFVVANRRGGRGEARQQRRDGMGWTWVSFVVSSRTTSAVLLLLVPFLALAPRHCDPSSLFQRRTHHAALAFTVTPRAGPHRRRRSSPADRIPGRFDLLPPGDTRRRVGSAMTMSPGSTSNNEPNWDSNDPFEVLGLAGAPTSDPQLIKRAYKRLALQYHPDVSPDPDKKRASDRFAKINWAYQTLTGKLQDQKATSSSSSTSQTSGGGWTPPHRRRATSSAAGTTGTSRPSGSGGGPSTDWRDYMPRYDDDEAYDANGDSLGAIFRDLVVGAASGGRGVLKDFVDFLEQNVDGYGISSLDGDDADLKILLRTGTLGDIGDEMDTTELVVKQLTEKLRQLDEELVLSGAEAKIATKYMEKLQLDERLQEVKARKKVVEGYIGKARKRLLSLQTRYKEMVVAGDNDPKSGGRSVGRSATGSSWSGSRDTTSTYQTRSSSPSAAGYESTSQRPRHDNPDDKWKDDSFGSFGRGRGSSRRQRASQPQSSSASTTSSAAGSTYEPSSTASARDPSTASSSGSYRSASSSPVRTSPVTAIPPHRVGPYSYDEDKRRLRDLKVDEDFDKLKKDLGL